MKRDELEKRILISITGKNNNEWKFKLKDINKRKIKRIALFLSQFNKKQREEIYSALQESCVKEIPFVHARDDMRLEEYNFLIKEFKTRYFNLHERDFPLKKELKPIYRKLTLEMNFDDKLNKRVNLKQIAGFCIDLSHFKASQERWTKDFLFVLKNKNKTKFLCNHLNGYSYQRRRDLHKPSKKSHFNYLKTLPKFLFGKYIALEMQVSVKKQLEFKKHIIELLINKCKI